MGYFVFIYLDFITSGAFVTRYISYEGMMPIREGAAENQFYSDIPHCFCRWDSKYETKILKPAVSATNNSFYL
jgi:hypothetical protein